MVRWVDLPRIVGARGEDGVDVLGAVGMPLFANRMPEGADWLGPPLRARGARLIHIIPDGDALELDESSVPSIW